LTSMPATHSLAEVTEETWAARRQRVDEERELLRKLKRERAELKAETAKQIRTNCLLNEHLLCQKVQQLRAERGWSQAELAKRLSEIGFEMHQTTVAKLEAGKRPLRVAETFALAQVFGLPPLAMFRMPVQGEDYGMKYMRERLTDIDEYLEETEKHILATVDTLAKTYAERSAERAWLADAMRRVSAEADNGEHQETT
jgi:transcriptional regulator with XRE-family HTH domain